MWWDTLIAIVIILALLLAIVARLTKQTITEIFGNIMDFFKDRKEDMYEPYLS